MTTKIIEQQRAEFEAWAKTLPPELNFGLERHPTTGWYVWFLAIGAWKAWQEQERRFAELVKTQAAMKRLLAHAISRGCEFETDGDESLDAVLAAMAKEE